MVCRPGSLVTTNTRYNSASHSTPLRFVLALEHATRNTHSPMSLLKAQNTRCFRISPSITYITFLFSANCVYNCDDDGCVCQYEYLSTACGVGTYAKGPTLHMGSLHRQPFDKEVLVTCKLKL